MKKGRKSNFGEYMICGGIGAMVSSTLTHPLDLVQTRFQSSRNLKTLSSARTSSVFGRSAKAISQIVKLEGVFGLWRGILPALAGYMPGKAIFFGIYESTKDFFKKRTKVENSYYDLIASSIASVVCALILNPVFVLKTRIQIQEGGKNGNLGKNQYNGYYDCTKKIMKTEGLVGFFRGFAPSLLGISDKILFFVAYEKIKRVLGINEKMISSKTFPVHYLMAITSSLKICVAIIVYPHEVIRTRMREVKPCGSRKYTGIVQTTKTILREEGFSGMYGGLQANLLRVVPNTVFLFLVYEFLKNRFFKTGTS